ncbi:GNAT family N-acetyltransferase [Streptomyces acidiscabies]|uniref:GNAT family N-acetyltransferase n=2 Tax=Streptomyces acidiscabies TaxID=42234 RepID=A0AAP6B884_9ACTN|nr:GNAT family N-acetyltransferase [Streptomyces acidiscabies]MBP5940756.1 GNAT family N-acetyltransferase [Streptomyces sp. LBUM 1476]MBZ3912036.1 GNAT family N-acetyltransferase [Streptomyces acidiscabies]MDX2959845.1 GNAT family N-acetyltransferase [Streptomyces acidiscabies]MDX3022357.1 GNAT family N-acetyltransferase [Streptomyces acidiscabies]MDX3792477.1 GNAT family N-acetyltransferase [Streptomyces acidiscabies]
MTTTLRPTEPLQREPGPAGRLSRRYQVCVNSRPVGTLHLGTHPGFGPTIARIEELRIDEADRRRGRATVAALAAEEVARGWGCRSIEVYVPVERGTDPATSPGIRLATALGYVLRNRGMEKPLGTTAPPLPPGLTVRPIAETEFRPFIESSYRNFAQECVERGITRAEADTRVARELPGAHLTLPGTTIDALEHPDGRLGTLWLAPDGDNSYIYDIEVTEEFRGKGYGRTLMHLAEARAIERGSTVIGLNVFADNAPAERLYESLGYETVGHGMYKAL